MTTIVLTINVFHGQYIVFQLTVFRNILCNYAEAVLSVVYC
jgi:hypothetical protein